ncbi:hypothetical protein SD51_11615 [Alicyclobacillus tengchongensis]|nr:hypothetical protein SD51_11615 [Alicyclobacillus tengchongensis]
MVVQTFAAQGGGTPMRGKLATLTGTVVFCAALLVGCAPGVQKASIASGTATTIVKPDVSFAPLVVALHKSEQAQEYKLLTTVTIQNANLKTSFTEYGTLQMPNMANIQVHENNFNIGLYQQGQVAYQQDGTVWSKTEPVANLDAYQGYADIIDKAMQDHLQLAQMDRTYVVDEYCDVYRVIVPNGVAGLPTFLQQTAGTSIPSIASHSSPVEYIFYVGESSGYIRQVQTQSVNVVDAVGSLSIQTSTIFSDIDNAQLAQVQIPSSLVGQLEHGVE